MDFDILIKTFIGSGGAIVSCISGAIPQFVGVMTILYLGISIYYKIQDHRNKK